jgi:uncharacterized protein Veg
MAEKDFDWGPASELAATLIEGNRKSMEAEIGRRVQERYNSQFITQLNKARGTMKVDADLKASASYKKGYTDGLEEGRRKHEIGYRCSICNEPITMVPMGEDHKAMVQYMHEHGWHHGTCQES